MFKILLSVFILSSVILFKFDFYFKQITNEHTIDYVSILIVVIPLFCFVQFYKLLLGVFSTNGPISKFLSDVVEIHLLPSGRR